MFFGMLVGREPELLRVSELLERARTGTSGALVLRGEPGIGKSALVEWALKLPVGLRTIVCNPIESESEIAFSGLLDLVGPLRHHLETIPAHHAETLAGALALGPPVAGDRFTVYAATLSLLAAAAEGAPLLIAVDDAQWLDRPSSEALLFTARRLGTEGIALLVALRADHASVFEGGGLPELELCGLSGPECAALLSGRGHRLAQATVEELHKATGGNPLAVLEIAAVLSEGQLAGTEPLGDPLPAGANAERAFLRRVADLPAEARRALLVASAADSEDMAPVAGALRSMGIDAALLQEAEDGGLVRLEGHRIAFAHPLIRSCVYHSAEPSERRAAHRALAAILAKRGSQADNDRAAWQLAAAAVEPDAAIAGALEEVAVRARERSGLAAASLAFERAAELSPGAGNCAGRLLEAAEAALLGGQTGRAKQLSDRALEAATAPMLLARIEHTRGRAEMWQGRTVTAFQLLTAGAAKYRETDPLTACLMLVDASLTCILNGDVEAAVGSGEQAWQEAKSLGGPAQVAATVVYASGLTLEGLTSRASDLLAEIVEPLDTYTSAGRDLFIPTMAARLMAWLERYEDALKLIGDVKRVAKAGGTVEALPLALATQADVELDVGNWNAAYASAHEAIDLARATSQQSSLSYCLVVAARQEAVRGLEDECTGHTDEALTLVGMLGDDSFRSIDAGAVGSLNLGLGRYQRAAVELMRAGEFTARHNMRHPGVVRWSPDLIEAFAHLGRNDEAGQILATLESQAELVGTRWAKAAAARCRGMLVDTDFDRHFETALETHQRDVLPFERARTELGYGEKLRRSRRRGDARPHLREALETFERLGATPWADRARAELRASGERARRRDLTTAQRLTPQEHTVAEAVTRGATNKEVAATLFLSPKTVESHLSRIYAKLGVRSRTELTALLAGDGRSSARQH